MNKRLIINTLLALFIVGLALIVWLKPGQQQSTANKLVPLQATAIHTIVIEQPKGVSITLAQVSEQWVMTQPIQAPALPGKIERLLKISQIKTLAEYPLDNSQRHQFGLDSPQARISYNNTQLSIGATEPVKSRRYVANKKNLYLVDDTFIHYLTAPVSAYIDTRLFDSDEQIIELKTPSIHLVLQTDNTWVNTLSPEASLASDDVQVLLDEWRFARAINISITDTDNQRPDITITLSNGKEYSFSLSKDNNTVVLKADNTPLHYHFSADKYKKMTELEPSNDA